MGAVCKITTQFLSFVCICVSLTVPFSAAAQSSSFTVTQQYVSGDNTPPTTPGPLTATTSVHDQVALVWGASTDNIMLGGYQVFRDGAQIATTTLNSYTDTGLTPSTTYAYYVIAFDTDFNFSSSSNIAFATTTDAPPPPPPAATSTDSGPQVSRPDALTLQSLDIVPNTTSVEIAWTTNRFARYVLRWGESQNYELGFVTNQLYQKSHQTLITDLDPNTYYQYELIGYDRGGNKVILSRSQFKTLALPDATVPPNVALFKATVDNDDVLLTWKNPAFDFAVVRIVRNPHFYPTDPNNGYVVYQGSDEQFMDRNALRDQPRSYYTAFAYDAAGNRSSGATAIAVRSGVGDRPSGEPSQEPIPVTSDQQPTSTPLLTISLENVVILQNDEVIRSVDSTYVVDTSQPFTIQAPYELFPEHLKAIQLTLHHPVDESISYSYLLRINRNTSAYEAMISQLGFLGTIPLKLSVYDYETEQTAVATGSIISKEREPVTTVVEDVAPAWWHQLWWLLLILLLLVLWWILARRRSKGG